MDRTLLKELACRLEPCTVAVAVESLLRGEAVVEAAA